MLWWWAPRRAVIPPPITGPIREAGSDTKFRSRFRNTTLNIQSFMGAIMAVGIAVANAILLVTFAERSRLEGEEAIQAALSGASSRLRPILMTSVAMIAGMVPMAIGLGEGGEQAAPLGRAVVGGLLGGTFATLFVLPDRK